jgi:hypothetical protein
MIRKRLPKVSIVAVLLLSAILWDTGNAAADDLKNMVSGDSVIRGEAGPSEIVITTTSRLAGAIHSLTWNGQEFIDSFDHGRQLQSACSFDLGQPEFHAECFNPTEAGSRNDGRGNSSTSQLLKLVSRGHELKTTTQMAFWLQPGQKSSGKLAKNRTLLSRDLVSKHVRIGYKGLPHVIEYNVTFKVPSGERHKLAQFEALTGYMPTQFSSFLKFDPKSGKLITLSDGPGEQRFPVVLSTPDGKHAMGVFSPQQPAEGFEHAGYGRFRFSAAKVVKWNCVFRVRDATTVKPGEYHYRMFVVVGTRNDVRESLIALHHQVQTK